MRVSLLIAECHEGQCADTAEVEGHEGKYREVEGADFKKRKRVYATVLCYVNVWFTMFLPPVSDFLQYIV